MKCTKYLPCGKFLSFSLHVLSLHYWVFITNCRIRHYVYCRDEKGSEIQTIFFKDMIAHMCWNKYSQVHPPAWESTCLSWIFMDFSISLREPSFFPWLFLCPRSSSVLKLQVSNLSHNHTLKDWWSFYVTDENVGLWRQKGRPPLVYFLYPHKPCVCGSRHGNRKGVHWNTSQKQRLVLRNKITLQSKHMSTEVKISSLQILRTCDHGNFDSN